MPETAARLVRRTTSLAIAASAAVVGGACGGDAAPAAAPGPSDAPSAPWFREEARARGLVFDHHTGHGAEFLLPEMACAGCALFDMDGDGDLDAYVLESDGVRKPRAERRGNRLFRNRGDGTFEDASEGSGADDRGYGMGVACGDADGDGDTDLLVTNLDGLALLRNDGGGRFTDVTDAAGLRVSAWGTSAAFLDYDRDGDLDLYVACYVRWSPEIERRCDSPQGGADWCSPRAYGAPAPDHLFRNEGGGRFADVSEAAGLRTAFGNGLGVVAADFDGDGLPDVFVANDGVENQLWIQRPDGTFRDEALARGCAMDRNGVAKAGMGVVAADFDDDGDRDVLVVNLVDEGDSLYRNDGGRFTDRTAASGLAAVSRAFTRFGLCAADFDLDGRLDLHVANGRVTRLARPYAADPYAEPNQVLRGTDALRFEEVLPRGGTDPAVVTSSRGSAAGDVDGDGDVDLLVTNKDGPAHLFVNVAPRRGGFVVLRATERSGADALGATVSVRLGARRVVRDVRAASGYCSSSDPRVHLGLGDATEAADVRVRWVDGSAEAFGDLPAGGVHELRRGAGRPAGRDDR